MQFRAMMIMVLLGSIDLTMAKKSQHYKTYKKGHKKSGSRLVPSLPTMNAA